MAKRCAVCNELNPEEATTCSYCGTALSETKPRPTASSNTETEAGGPAAALAGKFRLERKIGQGEHTEVYAALSVKKQASRYALKCYRPVGEAERYMVSGLLQRAGKARELRHENIVSVYGYVLEKDYYIVVMDVVDGLDAATHLKKVGPLSPYDAWNVARSVLGALDYAYEQGIVHGNLKPSNIFIPETPGGPVLISDFGFGAVGWNSSTAIYAAPELLKGQSPSPQSDQYSLGIILFELLIGQPPFTITAKSEDGRKLQRSRINVRAVTALPQPLQDVIGRLLDREPANRFASLSEAAAALDPQQARQLQRTARPETYVDDHRVRTLLAEADKALTANRPERAAELLAQAAKLHPDDLEIRARHDNVNDILRQRKLAEDALLAGQRAFKEQRFGDAVQALSRAEQLMPANAEITALLLKARQSLARQQAPQSPPSPPPTAVPKTTVIPKSPPRAPIEPPQPQPEPPPREPPRVPPASTLPKPTAAEPRKSGGAPWKLFLGLSGLFIALLAVIGLLFWRYGLPTDSFARPTPRSLPSPLPVVSSRSLPQPTESSTDPFEQMLDQEEVPDDHDIAEEEWLAEEGEERRAAPVAERNVRKNASAADRAASPSEPAAVPDTNAPLFDLADFEEDEKLPEIEAESKSILVFKTYPPERRAAVYLDGKHVGITKPDKGGNLPLIHHNVTVGDHLVRFVSLTTKEEDFYNVTVRSSDEALVYVLTVAYEKPPEPKDDANAKAPVGNIPSAAGEFIEPPP